jgi:O-antigen/teichoic acid export membrane protein
MPLPEGTLPVAIGLMVAGLSSFAFFAVGEAALGSEEAFKPVVSMWFATFALAPGCFLPLEQELGRALASRRALGQGGRPVVMKVLTLGAILAGLITLLLLIGSPWLSNDYFGGDWVMVVALMIAIAAYAPTHLARGICSGSGRFQSYAIVLGADGLVRVLLCVALAVVGVSSVGAFGLAVAVAPLAGVLIVGWRRDLRTEPGPAASWQEVTPNLGWLLLGSLMAASLVNAGPIATNLLAADNEEAFVTRFGQGVILARIPLFLFQAVQAALLPRLARQAAAGEMDEFRSGFKRLMKLVLAVGVAGTVGAWFLGPFAADLLFGADLTQRTLAVLAAGSAFYMLGLAIAQAVIALHGHAQVALGWTVGMVTFALSTWLIEGEVFRRVELGLLIGSASAMAVFAFALRTRLRSGAVPSEASVLEAMTDMPFEG